MAAIGYTRVSSDKQAESGAGMAAQAAAIKSYAKQAGIELVESYSDDGISGAAGIEGRPGLAAAIGRLRRGDVLVIAKRDRLGRDMMTTLTIERAVAKRGASIVSADGVGNGDGAADAFMRSVMDAAAQFERDLVRIRTRAAMAEKRKANHRIGDIPFGWSLAADGKLEAVAAEQEILDLIRELRESGVSLRRIADQLTDLGIVTKKGNAKWSHSTVRSVLARERLMAA
jgi:DNA invertase Pin-like site-specific DNA recombinase